VSDNQLSIKEKSKSDVESGVTLCLNQEKELKIDEGIKDLAIRLTVLEEYHKPNLLKSIYSFLTKFLVIPVQGITVVLSVIGILIGINFYINNENNLSFQVFFQESLIKIIDSKTINQISISNELGKNTNQQQVLNQTEKLPALYYYKSGDDEKNYHFKNPNKNKDMLINFNSKTYSIAYTSGDEYTVLEAKKYGGLDIFYMPKCIDCVLTKVSN